MLCPLRFQGQWEDGETGLYYNRFRYYDPLVGQYMSPDPIGLVGGINPHGYVPNPNAWVDPLGLAAKGAQQGGKTYNPLKNQGPLDSRIRDTFRSGTYKEVITNEPTTLYRVWGVNAKEIGPYWTRTKPSGPVQSVIDSSLDPKWGNTATNVTKIEIPPGIKIYEGIAAPQRGLVGNGNQIYIDMIEEGWIVK